MRIMKGYHLLGKNTFMRQVKALFFNRLQMLIVRDPVMAENSDLDNNNITLILMITNFFRTFKLVIVILTVSYFMGMMWYIFCDLTRVTNPTD